MWKNTDYPQELLRAKQQTQNIAMAAIAGRQRAGASEKLRAIVQQPVQSFVVPPFIGANSDLPLGVVGSFLRRKSEIWGRFE